MHFDESPRDRQQLETFKTERRRKPRITHPFPSTVCGVAADGNPFKIMTIIDNVSANGLHLCLRQKLEERAPISVVIHINGLPPGDDPEPHVFFEGEVLRVDTFTCGYGYGVASRGHRIRYMKFVSALASKYACASDPRTRQGRNVPASRESLPTRLCRPHDGR
ncbi:MAG: hypothetical protein QOF61_443 [Acidobacteriota bacterium]|jgi:hypothetical protein|nr:hypothetical protein [Acidobacteriota bacterium]